MKMLSVKHHRSGKRLVLPKDSRFTTKAVPSKNAKREPYDVDDWESEYARGYESDP